MGTLFRRVTILQGCKIYRLCIVADLIGMRSRMDGMSR